VAQRLASAVIIGIGTLTLSAIAYAGSLAVCRGENVGSSSACVVVAAAIAIRCPTGRWAWTRFVPMAAWASYLLVVIVTSRHGQELYPEPVGLSTRAAVPSPGSV
jgi:hypothetical protein